MKKEVKVYENLSEKTKLLIAVTLEDFKIEQVLEPAMYLDVEGDEKFAAFPLPGEMFNSKMGKRILVGGLKDFIKHIETKQNKMVEQVIFVSEVWMGKANTKEEAEKITSPVSETPDAKEGLMISIETKTQDKMLFYEIIRNKENNVVISDYPVEEVLVDKSDKEGVTSIFRIW